MARWIAPTQDTESDVTATSLPTTSAVVADFEVLYRRHYRDVYRFALGLTRSNDDAGDIAGETFERAFRAWSAGALTPERPLSWLLLTARRIATDRWRRARRLASLLQRGRGRPADGAGEGRTEFWLWFDAVARILSDRQREVLLLRYQRDLTDADIAHILGISESGVRSLVARAIAVLRAPSGAAAMTGHDDIEILAWFHGRLAGIEHEVPDPPAWPARRVRGSTRAVGMTWSTRRGFTASAAVVAIVVIALLAVIPGLAGRTPSTTPPARGASRSLAIVIGSDGLPTSIGAEPVLSVPDALSHALATPDATTFLVGGWLDDAKAACPMPFRDHPRSRPCWIRACVAPGRPSSVLQRTTRPASPLSAGTTRRFCGRSSSRVRARRSHRRLWGSARATSPWSFGSTPTTRRRPPVHRDSGRNAMLRSSSTRSNGSRLRSRRRPRLSRIPPRRRPSASGVRVSS